MGTITWPVAFTIIAGLVVAITGLVTFILNYFKQDVWKDPVSALKIKAETNETEIKNLKDRIKILSRELEAHDKRDSEDFNRVERKIEKLTELLIELVKSTE